MNYYDNAKELSNASVVDLYVLDELAEKIDYQDPITPVDIINLARLVESFILSNEVVIRDQEVVIPDAELFDFDFSFTEKWIKEFSDNHVIKFGTECASSVLSNEFVMFDKRASRIARELDDWMQKPKLYFDDEIHNIIPEFNDFEDSTLRVREREIATNIWDTKMDSFAEEDYTAEKLKEIIKKLLSGVLEIKVGHNIESILRDINDDWYNIKYKVVMDNDNIDVMSPGKKALVLLKLLIDLAESKCPILIDQPEDDLDNRSVFDELIPFIRRKKKERQIIVVTHNANVVLGADAEEIIIANQTGSKSENKEKRFEYRSGAIENDNPVFDTDGNIEVGILNSKGIQQHICDILEGGEIAFEKRKNKYRI